MATTLKKYQKLCHELALEFVKMYYVSEKMPIQKIGLEWFNDDVGGALVVDVGKGKDMWGMDAIAHAIEMRATGVQVMQWYTDMFEATKKGDHFPNLKMWMKIHGSADQNAIIIDTNG